MSVLGLTEVIRRIREENLIEGLGGRDLANPEGVGIDLRLGSVHRIMAGGAYIEADGEAGLGKRKGVATEEVARFTEGATTQPDIEIHPGEYLLVQTVESVNGPADLMPVVYPRTSLFRAGLQLLMNKADPGYCGPYTFGLANLSAFPVRLQLGARFCNVVFHVIEGESVAYRGQHQGGRLVPGEEQQV